MLSVYIQIHKEKSESTNVEKELNAYNDVHDALHQSCEIHDARVRGLDPIAGIIWPYSKIYLILENLFLFPNIYI